MSTILYRLLWYWIKGSAFVVVIAILAMATGGEPLVRPSHSAALNWIATFGLAITPVGAICGLIVLGLLVLILSLLFPRVGIEKEKITRLATWTPKISVGKRYDYTGRYAGVTTPDGKHYDAAGRYAGETTPDGRHFDKHGRYNGQTTDNGRRYDKTGRYAGQTTEDGQHYDDTGKSVGKTDK
jgi:YD repeat-containing protein